MSPNRCFGNNFTAEVVETVKACVLACNLINFRIFYNFEFNCV